MELTVDGSRVKSLDQALVCVRVYICVLSILLL